MMQELARITPAQIAVPYVKSGTVLSRRQKAAIIVRLLLAEGCRIPLTSLPEDLQTELARQIGQMNLIDQTTLQNVVDEFLNELEQVGLSFPNGLKDTISLMDGHLSSGAANHLRKILDNSPNSDPWDRITQMEPETLLPLLQNEGIEVIAIILSKLPVNKAADLLGNFTGEKARRIAYAMSKTANVAPNTVHRIGHALLSQLEQQPVRAFQDTPVKRIGAILNVTSEQTREDVLRALEEDDQQLAQQVRKAIFTFVDIPLRLETRDIPKMTRVVDQDTLVTALAAARGQPEKEAAAEFILTNLSQRMAQTLRESIEERGKIKEKDGESAMSQIIIGIRELEASGEITLKQEEEEPS